MSTHLVFVYGSLKAGFHNHDYFLAHAVPLGDAATVAPYLMLSGRAFPFLIDPEALPSNCDMTGAIGPVRGEVYAIGEATLDRLDRLEGHPDFYRRERVRVRMADPAIAETVPAWIYLLQANPAEMISPPVVPDADGTVSWQREHYVSDEETI